MYAIGVGSGVDNTELEEIASGPEFVIKSPSFEKIQTIPDEVAMRVCGGRDR